MAAFIVEPIQGKGVNIPDDGYLSGAQELCQKYGTLFIADEIQTGLGRTGRFLAIEHWGVEPDMILLSKTLSGGHVPVAAVLARKWILDRVFDRMDRAVVHCLTFANNDLAMAAGIATLEVIESERLIENAARMGARLLTGFQAMASGFEMIRDVRGKGLMIGNRIRATPIAQTAGGLEFARGRKPRALLSTDHHPPLQTAPDSGSSSRTREPYGETPTRARHLRRRLRLDRKLLQGGNRR